MERLTDINDLLIQQVRFIHDGEKRISKITPKILEKADYTELKEFLMKQSIEKQHQLSRLGEAFKHLEIETNAEKNESVRCLIDNMKSLIRRCKNDAIRDTYIAIYLRSLSTLQINAYQTAVSCAVETDNSDVIRLLRRNLREEKGLEKHLGLLEEVCIEDLEHAPVVVNSEFDQFPL